MTVVSEEVECLRGLRLLGLGCRESKIITSKVTLGDAHFQETDNLSFTLSSWCHGGDFSPVVCSWLKMWQVLRCGGPTQVTPVCNRM